MRTSLLTVLLLTTSPSAFCSACETAAESAAMEKFRNPEYGCYGNAILVEKLNSNTMNVTVAPVGGYGACTQKIYQVKFKESERSCTIISVNRIGMGGI